MAAGEDELPKCVFVLLFLKASVPPNGRLPCLAPVQICSCYIGAAVAQSEGSGWKRAEQSARGRLCTALSTKGTRSGAFEVGQWRLQSRSQVRVVAPQEEAMGVWFLGLLKSGCCVGSWAPQSQGSSSCPGFSWGVSFWFCCGVVAVGLKVQCRIPGTVPSLRKTD